MGIAASWAKCCHFAFNLSKFSYSFSLSYPLSLSFSLFYFFLSFLSSHPFCFSLSFLLHFSVRPLSFHPSYFSITPSLFSVFSFIFLFNHSSVFGLLYFNPSSHSYSSYPLLPSFIQFILSFSRILVASLPSLSSHWR